MMRARRRDVQRERAAPMLPSGAGIPGRTADGNRVLNRYVALTSRLHRMPSLVTAGTSRSCPSTRAFTIAGDGIQRGALSLQVGVLLGGQAHPWLLKGRR